MSICPTVNLFVITVSKSNCASTLISVRFIPSTFCPATVLAKGKIERIPLHCIQKAAVLVLCDEAVFCINDSICWRCRGGRSIAKRDFHCSRNREHFHKRSM